MARAQSAHQKQGRMKWPLTMLPALHGLIFLLLLNLSLVQSFGSIQTPADLVALRTAILKVSGNNNAKDSADATSVPFHAVVKAQQQEDSTTNADRASSLLFSSDFVPRKEISSSKYNAGRISRHNDCIALFDEYSSEVKRCEAIDDDTLNIRWRATWIPAGSRWLYRLANACGWAIETRSADPYKVSSFSWKPVFSMFANAVASGNITLPISEAEGNTIVSIQASGAISITEALDLVKEADGGRLLNRRVAQEFASWLDVRRPDECGINEDEWAGMVRERILLGVPGAGALDVDPNEDDGEGAMALLIFGAFCSIALALSFQYFFAPEIVGGTGTISAQCDDAARIEFGSGYLSECFGPYGDGPFVR